ncbi:SA1362 family protein [Niallia nealsonii]|uniref:SA1362 family protein n=1 Tax=Niallia nealsonii TaxID=115979 RepID=UPI001F18DD9D|nr:SA1362 family protein [Niallia nealsonii]
MAFLKNRISIAVISFVILFASIGLVSRLITDPIGFVKNIAVLLVVGVLIWFIAQRLYKSSPQKKEQKAFIKAAKKSKKRLNFKEKSSNKPASLKSNSSLKAKKFKRSTTSAHLTVIEGKKGKKKNRASL